MANLNGENYVRMVPKLTHEQLEAIKLLREWNYTSVYHRLRYHGSWTKELKSLNSLSQDDILYVLATGEYELKVDDYEAYLMERVEHFRKLYNVYNDTSAKDCIVIASNALDQYRKFRANEE